MFLVDSTLIMLTMPNNALQRVRISDFQKKNNKIK